MNHTNHIDRRNVLKLLAASAVAPLILPGRLFGADAPSNQIFWQADAGTILCDSMGRADHDSVWLVSEKEYGDFELRLKFHLS